MPIAVTEAGGFIWVANRSDGTVSRVDPATHEVMQVAVGGAPSALATGFGFVWVADFRRDVVVRIDPATGRVVGAPLRVASGPVALAAGPSAVWVASVVDGTVQRIDPRTLGVSGPVRVGHGPIALATAGGGVWALNALDRSLVRVDAGARVSAPVPVPAGAAALHAAFGRLWVAGSSAGVLAVHDPVSGRRVRPAVRVDDRTGPGRGPTGLASGPGRLWVANNNDKTVLGVDREATVSPPRRFAPGVGTAPIPVRAVFAFGSLWVTDFDADGVVRVEVGE